MDEEERLFKPNRNEGPRPALDMTQDFVLWRHQVRKAVAGLLGLQSGDASLQQGDSGGERYRQSMFALYQESRLLDFLSFQAWRQAGLSSEAAAELDALRQQLDAYDEPDTDAEILADQSWQAILAQAQRVKRLLG